MADEAKKYLKGISKLQKAYLSRRVCWMCEIELSKGFCSAVYERCDDKILIQRMEKCLSHYKPKKKSS